MDTRAVLAKMTTRAQGYEVTGGSGHSALDMTDVAGAMGMISGAADRYGSLICLAKYADDRQAEQLLVERVGCFFARRCSVNGWPVKYSQVMARLAVAEHLDRHCCGACGGSGTKPVMRRGRQIIKSCSRCGGSGRARPTEAERAEFVGVCRDQWRKAWRDRFDELMVDINIWEDACLSKLCRKMRAA